MYWCQNILIVFLRFVFLRFFSLSERGGSVAHAYKNFDAAIVMYNFLVLGCAEYVICRI